jgi:hypothetical protein
MENEVLYAPFSTLFFFFFFYGVLNVREHIQLFIKTESCRPNQVKGFCLCGSQV